MTEMTDERWDTLVKAAAAIGEKHGTNAADWWFQDNLGGRASGDVKARARDVLAKLEECDTDDLGLPNDGMSGEYSGEYGMAQLYAELGISEEDDDDSLSLVTAYQDAFSSAEEAKVSEYANGLVEAE